VLSRYTTSVSGSIATVTSGSRVSHGWTGHSNFAYSPVGTVQHVTASGGWESCGWSVPLAYVGSHTRSDGRFHAAVRSGSPQLTSGCDFTSAGFLPPRLYPRHTWVATTYGAPWYPGVSMVSTTTAMPDYTTFTSGSLSGSHYYRRVVGHSVRWTTWTGTIETGSPFATVLEDGAP